MTMMISLESSGMVFDAHHFDDLFDLYLADCTLAGVIPKTIESYTHQLRPFRVWWAARGPALQWQLSRPAMQEFGTWFRQEYTTQKGIPPAQNTLRSGCRRVRQFFNWLYRTGRIPVQISDWMELPAEPQSDGRCLDVWEIEALIHACHGMYRLRNAALVAFLFETGVRCVEASCATFDATTILPDGRGFTRLDFVKRNKDIDLRRTVVFGQSTGMLLKMLAFTTMRQHGKIFELTDKGVQYVLRSLAERAHIDVTTHDGRKTFATYWVRNYQGANPYLGELLLKKQLGHRPANVLEKHYLMLDHNDILEGYVSPLDGVTIPGIKMA